MEFQDVVRRRRMVRRYAPTPVDRASLERALHNATRAPSAGFSQGWGFLVLDEPDDLARWWAAATSPERLAEPDAWLSGMLTAPVVVLPCSSKDAYLRRYAEPDKGWPVDDEERWAMPYWHLDTAMASLLILQTAVDEGLGACFFGIPPEHVARVRHAFAIPESHEPIGAITIGHPAPDSAGGGSASRRPRQPIEDVVHHGRWRTG